MSFRAHSRFDPVASPLPAAPPGEGLTCLATYLTMEETARLLRVHVNTVKNWKKMELLRRGVDYLQAGKVVRIIVTPQLIERLSQPEEPKRAVRKRADTRNRRTRRTGGMAVPRVNLEYLE